MSLGIIHTFRDDIITCQSYKGLCDYVYSPGIEPVGGVVHCNMEELPDFFEAIKGRPDKYVLVSSCSDFGPCYQEEHPVWADMPKWARMATTPELGYKTANIAPRCNLDRCREEDKYSVKCYSWTAYTFAAIPPNVVRWFCTNSQLHQDPIVTPIPFGIAASGVEPLLKVRDEFHAKPPTRDIYVNWQDYTVERLELRNALLTMRHGNVTIVVDAKLYEDYLRDVADHRLILAPMGNGIDCYRTLEAVYLGVVPVVELNSLSVSFFDNLKISICPDLRTVPFANTKAFYESVMFSNSRKNNFAKLSYWKTEFEKARKTL